MGCGCCEEVVRYKKLVNNIFPDIQTDGPQQDSVIKLTEFAVSNTQKLHKISVYLQDRIESDLEKRRIGFVLIGMDAFRELITKCHGELNLFIAVVMDVIKLLLNDQDTQLQKSAILTLDRFSQAQTNFYSRLADSLDDVNVVLIQKCEEALADEKSLNYSLAATFLRGILAIVRMVDTIDSHLQDRLPSIVDIIMQVMNPEFGAVGDDTSDESPPDASAQDLEVIVDGIDQEWGDDDSPQMVRELAYELLVSMAGRTTSDSVRKIMEPMFEYLDETMSWSDFQFSYECVHALSSSVQSNFAYLTFSLLLDHLVESEQVPTKIAVARIIGELLTSSGDAIGMAAHHLNDALLQTLHYSLEQQHGLDADEDVEDNESSEFLQQKHLQDEVVSVLRQYAEIQHYAEQKVETAQFILQQMQHHEASSEAFSPHDNVAYLNCVHAVLKEVDKPLPSGTVVSQALISPMLRLAQYGVWETRLSVFNILATIITSTIDPFKATSVLKRSNSFKNANSKAAKAAKAAAKASGKSKRNKSGGRRGRNNSKPKNSQGAKFLKMYGQGLHSALLASALLPDNHPDHFLGIHSVCCCLLKACGPEVLQFTPPMMIRLQKALVQQQQMSSQEGGLDILQTRSAHSMIGAYFVYLGDHLECEQALEYVNSVMQGRSENSEHCELLEVTSHGEIDVIDIGYTDEHREKATYVSKLFNLEMLCEALDHSPLVNKHYENRILINEMNAQPFGLQAIESSSGMMSAGPSTDFATATLANSLPKSESANGLAGDSSPLLYPAPLDDARLSLLKPFRRRKSTYSSMRSVYDLQQKLAAVEKQHKLNQAGAAHHLRAIFTDNEGKDRPSLQDVNFSADNFDTTCSRVQEGLEKQQNTMSIALDLIDQLVQEATEEQELTNDDEVDLTVVDDDDSDIILSLSRDSLLKIQFPSFGVGGLKSRRAPA